LYLALGCLLLPVNGLQDPCCAQKQARALLNQFCLDCHGEADADGGLNLVRLQKNRLNADIVTWEKVVTKLRARQMPPVDSERPTEEEYKAALRELESALDGLAAEQPRPGRTETFRQLTRTEYQNAIRDLLALDIDATDLLPADPLSHGFDNITVGELSPTLLNRYVLAAEKIARAAVGRVGRGPDGKTFRVPADLTQERHLPGLPIGTRGGTLISYTFPQDGEYEITIRLARDRNEHVEGLRGTHQIDVLLDRERVAQLEVRPPNDKNHSLVDAHLKTRITVTAGPHNVGVTFPSRSFSLIETKRQPYQARFNYHRHPRSAPAIFQVSITGPYDATGPGTSTSRERLFVCQPTGPEDEDACATAIIRTLARRAWRGPVKDVDFERPLSFYRDARESGASFDAGIEAAVASVLVNPRFLFRIERDPPGTPPGDVYPISDLELASRLSFFLWSSIPDDELLGIAERGELSQPKVLAAQTQRMLDDERAQTLIENFAGQWLYLRNLTSVSPDMRLFPDFDDNLRQAMRRETELFFASIVREDRSVLDLLSADYSFLNERLAKHYGIPGVYGSRFRRVNFGTPESGTPLRGVSPTGRVDSTNSKADPSKNETRNTGADLAERGATLRGGLLRQASVLTVTSYATRTSPVIRGNWILENLMGTPAPPPPSNVPPLKDNAVERNQPLRERLAQHRNDPNCSGCHNLIDPVGFSLENFDAIGRWRDLDVGEPIDSNGGLPDGSRFVGVTGLEQALLQKPDLFVGTLTRKLMTYALGRGVDEHDSPAVRQILRQARENNYRFSSLIHGIVQSMPFQMRTTE
jgi:hypothetical protein